MSLLGFSSSYIEASAPTTALSFAYLVGRGVVARGELTILLGCLLAGTAGQLTPAQGSLANCPETQASAVRVRGMSLFHAYLQEHHLTYDICCVYAALNHLCYWLVSPRILMLIYCIENYPACADTPAHRCFDTFIDDRMICTLAVHCDLGCVIKNQAVLQVRFRYHSMLSISSSA